MTVAEQIKRVWSRPTTTDILFKRKKVSEMPRKISTLHTNSVTVTLDSHLAPRKRKNNQQKHMISSHPPSLRNV